MKTRLIKSAAFFFLIGGTGICAYAQTDKELLAKVAAENQRAVDALVLYPAETRRDILEAALYPEALIKMESMQAETAAAFKKAVEGYPKETRELIWDLTRYPGLARNIVRESGGSKDGIERVLKAHPAEIHDKALRAGLEHFDLLRQIDLLNESAESAFKTILNAYPPKTQTALKSLLDLPEVLSLLTENIRLTILAGDLYRKEPNWTLFQADSLHRVVARRNAQELENWKKSLDENPQAKEEMTAAARTYADENGYKDDLYDEGGDDLYYEAQPEKPVQIVERHYYHYPYWFGYPYWYDYPRWRPYPWWWDWGFYYGPGRSIVVIGLPSFHFTNWYFYHPWHHDRWYNLSGHFVRHYHLHQDSGGSISTGVTVWQRRHGTIIDGAWLKDDGRLQERFREYSRFEAGRVKFNRDNPSNQLEERDYLERNAGRYPEMSKLKPPRAIIEQPVPRPRTAAPAREPDMREHPLPQAREPRPERRPEVEAQPDRGRKKQPELRPAENRPEMKPARPPRIEQPEINKGREHHENVSEREKVRENTEHHRAPAPKVTPPKTKEPQKREKSGRTKIEK
jgi:hypothetical protein